MSEAILRQDDTTTKNGSTAGAVARALSTSFAFMFKRPPLRFFRPTKGARDGHVLQSRYIR